MVKDMTRAIRRHHYDRLKKKRKLYWGGYDYPNDEKTLGKIVSTPQMCSRYCCGNPRRHRGEVTLQEKRCTEAYGSREDFRRIQKEWDSNEGERDEVSCDLSI
jgi:hypothetical protein